MFMKQFFTFLLFVVSTTVGAQSYCYEDKDGDGFGDPNTAVVRTVFGCPLLGGPWVDNDLDCNDGDAHLNPNTVWYKDADNDGYTDGTIKRQCTRPTGYKPDNELAGIGDCNDNDPVENPNQNWFYDPDHDGYITGAVIHQCSRPGADYIPLAQVVSVLIKDQDCNQNDPLEHPNQKWYRDEDGDHYISLDYLTFPNLNPIIQCSRPFAYSAEPEIVSVTIFDCNDRDANINPGSVWYKDADNDGYSDGSMQTQCARPTNYKLPLELTATSGDCDDNDPLQHPDQVWYADADHDGHGDKFNDIRQCSRPGSLFFAASELAGIDDCIDTNPSMYPGAGHR
jgi:hypothetical protein